MPVPGETEQKQRSITLTQFAFTKLYDYARPIANGAMHGLKGSARRMMDLFGNPVSPVNKTVTEPKDMRAIEEVFHEFLIDVTQDEVRKWDIEKPFMEQSGDSRKTFADNNRLRREYKSLLFALGETLWDPGEMIEVGMNTEVMPSDLEYYVNLENPVLLSDIRRKTAATYFQKRILVKKQTEEADKKPGLENPRKLGN